MSVFDSLVDRLTAGKEDLAGAPKKLVTSALEMIDEDKEGLKALVDKLSASGLGEQVKSWVSTGPNLPVTADQIKKALSSGEIDRLALKTKLSVEEVTSHLAAALQQIVDKLTPDGEITADALKAKAQGILGKLGLGRKPDQTKGA